MCNRFLVASEYVNVLAAQFQAKALPFEGELDVRPTDAAPILARDFVRGRYELLMAAWGKTARGPIQINARSESLHEKSMFREAFRCRRCLIPAVAFYEFSETERFLVRMKDGSGFAMGGLFDSRLVDGKPLISSTVITTEPNDLIAQIHPRMPVILKESDWERWLDPKFYDVDDLQGMMQPFPSELLTMTLDGKKASARGKGSQPSLELG